MLGRAIYNYAMLYTSSPIPGKLITDPPSQDFEGDAVIQWENSNGLKSILTFKGKLGPGIEDNITFLSNDNLQVYDLFQQEQRRSLASFSLTAVAYMNDIKDRNDDIDSITFTLINFPDFFWITGPSTSSNDPILIHVEGWRIEIEKPLIEMSVRREGIRKRDYLITNKCRVSHENGQFELKKWKEIEEFLTYALSFCSGYWCSPVGIEASLNETSIWKDLSIPETGHLRPNMNWFPAEYPHKLTSLFKGAWRRMKNQEAWEATKRAIEWSLSVANLEESSEIRVVHAQLTLELLSWVVLVEEGQIMSAGGFEKLPAMDKMALLANWAGLPVSFPNSFGEFTDESKQENWNNSPEGLSNIRNKLVHPSLKNRTRVARVSSLAQHQAANWGLSLIELTILKLFAYDGVFVDRTLFWDTEYPTVPWAPPWTKPDKT